MGFGESERMNERIGEEEKYLSFYYTASLATTFVIAIDSEVTAIARMILFYSNFEIKRGKCYRSKFYLKPMSSL